MFENASWMLPLIFPASWQGKSVETRSVNLCFLYVHDPIYSYSSVKPHEKREGSGAHNWGNAMDDYERLVFELSGRSFEC